MPSDSCPTATAPTTTPRPNAVPSSIASSPTAPCPMATPPRTGRAWSSCGTELHEAFTEQPDKTAYSLTRRGDTTVETALPTRLL